jgi:hypothetical protein
MQQAERLRRWTRHEYERLIDHGFLDEDDPIELLGSSRTVETRSGSAAVELHGLRDGRADATITPLAAPAARIRVTDLLP